MDGASIGQSFLQMNGRLSRVGCWPNLRVEHWHLDAGSRPDIQFESTVVSLLLSGRPAARRLDDGRSYSFVSPTGSAWVCPIGTLDRNVEFVAPMEVLHLYLANPILPSGMTIDYGIDSARVSLANAQGVVDPLLLQIGLALKNIIERDVEPSDRLLIDGLQMALAGHLIANYSIERWQPPGRTPTLDVKRLARVLDFIKARLADTVTLAELAAEACLSPFHFSRLFREATGLPPYRYMNAQRVQAAKTKLSLSHSSLADIAFDTGFGSQAHFIRVFRKATGLTPGQYRSLNCFH